MLHAGHCLPWSKSKPLTGGTDSTPKLRVLTEIFASAGLKFPVYPRAFCTANFVPKKYWTYVAKSANLLLLKIVWKFYKKKSGFYKWCYE